MDPFYSLNPSQSSHTWTKKFRIRRYSTMEWKNGLSYDVRAAAAKAVKTPPARPPISVLRMVVAVSGPGVAMTANDTPRNPRNELTARSLVVI
jgi:hypothetical protein